MEQVAGKKRKKKSKGPSKPVNSFTVLPQTKVVAVKHLEAPQPEWFRSPTLFERDVKDGPSVETLSSVLCKETQDKLIANGMATLFPVQAKVIPYLMRSMRVSHSIRPRDVCISAPTGSGKTLSFVIPIVEHLKNNLESRLRVIVVVPVPELANQVRKVFDIYTKRTPIRVYMLTGKSVDQMDEYLKTYNIDILIGTPGTLYYLLTNSLQLDLKQLEVVVMDEADGLSSQGSDRRWMGELERKVYGNPSNNSNMTCLCSESKDVLDGQRMSLGFGCGCSIISYCSLYKPVTKWLFSATLSKDFALLENISLYHPILFSATATNSNPDTGSIPFTPDGLTHRMILVNSSWKPLVVWYLLQTLGYRRVLCFAGSVDNAHRLYLLLQSVEGVRVSEVSSSLTTKDRSTTLKKFAKGDIDVIVTSDVMARGIDVESINYVISYDVPVSETGYIHRVGRTARAGHSGTAITLVTNNELKRFRVCVTKAFKWTEKHFEETVRTIPVTEFDVEPLVKSYEFALKRLEGRVTREGQRGSKDKRKSKKRVKRPVE